MAEPEPHPDLAHQAARAIAIEQLFSARTVLIFGEVTPLLAERVSCWRSPR